jgi:hypothetical protein
MAPLGLSLFFVGIKLLEGQPLAAGWRDMRAKMAHSLVAAYCLWIPVQVGGARCARCRPCLKPSIPLP